MEGRMQQQRVCVAAAARRATVMMVAMGSFKCFTATQAKMMLDLIRHGNKTASLVRAH